MEKASERLCLLRGYENKSEVKIICFLHLNGADLEESLKFACNGIIKKIVIIYETMSVKPSRVVLLKSLCDFDMFEYKKLNILLNGHRLIPLHTKLTEKERDEVISAYGENNLPSICLTDPIVQLYDFKRGDIIKIKRKKGDLYYRRVVDG